MPLAIPDLLLWLFVINLGVAFGAGLYEHRIVVPQWFVRSPTGIRVDREAMLAVDTGRQFWAFVTTIPLTLLTLANLVVAWQSQSPRREWWLAAVAMTLVERVATFCYFIPNAVRMMRGTAGASTAAQWTAFNGVRLFLGLVGWLSAMRALQF
jgi:hypothetical protein